MPPFQIGPAARAELAPNGTLRAAVNYGNAVLVRRDAEGPGGLSADLVRELGRRLGVPLAFITYDSAGKVVQSLEADQAWDVCFVAIDPLRAETIALTAPYVVIEGVYTTTADSPLSSDADLGPVQKRRAAFAAD